MKKLLNILMIGLILPILFISTANAETIYHYGDGTSGTTPPTPTQAEVGGFAVVNPETGVVHGVIAGSIENFSGNDRTMGHEYMGCPAGCLIIQQSTSDQNGNVAGTHGPNIVYDQQNDIFRSKILNDTQTQTITEFASNSSTIQTNIDVFISERTYEFGLLDYKNNLFNFVEISPAQNTNAQISATTKEYACEESALICSEKLSNSSTVLNNETVIFTERKTSEQIEQQVISEARTKIREQINLILSMLGKWTIN